MRFLTSVGKLLLDWVYPNRCLHCHRLISTGILCDECNRQLERVERGDRVKQVPFSTGIDRVFSCWYFNEVLQSVIHSLKYRDRARLGRILGMETARALGKGVIQGLDYLIPVPLFKVKERSRGYNQSKWIAQGMGNQWNLPVRTTLLRRIRNTISQTTLNRDERLRNMDKAFVISQPLNGRAIGIIDDVLTTGATISACAQVLKEAGIEEIRAITVATPKMED